MGFIATDLASVPKQGWNWYIFLVEDSWRDEMRDALDRNFETLAREAGPETLVVKGTEWEEFYPKGFDRNVVDGDPRRLPALLVTNEHPDKIDWRQMGRPGTAKAIFLPLAEYERPSETLGSFLQRVVNTLEEPEALEALESGDGGEIREHWSWVNRYIKLEPSFFGFGVNLNEIIDDVLGE